MTENKSKACPLEGLCKDSQIELCGKEKGNYESCGTYQNWIRKDREDLIGINKGYKIRC